MVNRLIHPLKKRGKTTVKSHCRKTKTGRGKCKKGSVTYKGKMPVRKHTRR